MGCIRRLRMLVRLVAMVALLSPLPGAAEPFGFRCTQSPNCSCATSGAGHYEIICPPTGDSSLFTYNISPGHALLRCSSSVRTHDYSMLPTLPTAMSGVLTFNFMDCPLPETSLSDIIVKLGVPKQLVTVYFQGIGRNLSSNLKRSHLRGLESVSRLVLSGNSITNIPEDLFADMKNLTWLNLRSNKVHLHSGLFEPIPQLRSLELGNNELRNLPDGLFTHSHSLKQLNLWQNKLVDLSSDTFKGLNTLEELDLSGNGLQNLQPNVFENLPNLKFLNLDFNNFSSLPENLLANNTRLESFKLNHNNQNIVRLPDGMLSNLSNLVEIVLDNAKIETLSESLLWKSFQLKNISLAGNKLTTIPNALFRDQVNLFHLNLRNNKLTHIPDAALQPLKNLKILNLDNNQLSIISGQLFAGSISLLELTMSKNSLKEIANNAFLSTKNLETVDMSHNNLFFMESDEYNTIGPYSPFRNLLKLKNLYLSHNNITEICADWRILCLNLERLDLSYNKIYKIEFNDVHFLSKKIEINLRNNMITEIDFNRAEMIASSQENLQPDAYNSHSSKPMNVKVFIENNPIHCDCVLYYFVKYLKNDLDPQVRSLVNIIPGNTTCSSPQPMEGKPLTQLQPFEMICLLDEPQSQKRHCPKNCSCFVRVHDKSLIVDCSSHVSLPLNLPDVKSLSLNYTEFHYENNSLNKISSLGIQSNVLNGIKKLFVSSNNITSLYMDEIPKDIEVLDLRNNRITHVDPTVIDKLVNSSLKDLYFSGNPIICDCDNHPFISFLITNYKQVKDFDKLKCVSGEAIAKITLGDLCATTPAVIASSIVVAIFGFAVGVLAALYYKYQQEIKVWLFSKGLLLFWVTEEELDKDKIYDAFISFSHKDEDFVINKLVTELEGGQHPFKICLHFRDWMAGEWIPTQIARSVQDSRRTIVVLSPNFLESVWGRMEFRAAHNRALKEGRARVIVILYGDIGPTDNLDPELQAYLSMNTYVKWGDPWFWNKLRYALPHPSYSKHHIPTVSVSNKKGFDDRLELIHPSTPSTPPGQNTPPAHQAHTNPLMNHVNSIPNGIKTSNIMNGTITMNGLKVNGNAKHSDV